MKKEKTFFKKCTVLAAVSILTLAVGCSSTSETDTEEISDITRLGMTSTEYFSEENFEAESTAEEIVSLEIITETTEEVTSEEVSSEEATAEETSTESESVSDEPEPISEASADTNSVAATASDSSVSNPAVTASATPSSPAVTPTVTVPVAAVPAVQTPIVETPVEQAPAAPNIVLVWIDDTAAKYHTSNGCGMDNAYQVTLDEAVIKGKTPCGICYPQPSVEQTPAVAPLVEQPPVVTPPVEPISATYILNISTKKIHYPQCASVNAMKESNKKTTSQSVDSLILEGYVPCKKCCPH